MNFWQTCGFMILLAAGMYGMTLATGTTPIQTFELEHCPPYDQCTPGGNWNNPNCKCWDSK